MAVIVTVRINNDDPLHIIEIRRTTNTEEAVLGPDRVSEYAVADYMVDAFDPVYVTHRYGDPVQDLVINALTALQQREAER